MVLNIGLRDRVTVEVMDATALFGVGNLAYISDLTRLSEHFRASAVQGRLAQTEGL